MTTAATEIPAPASAGEAAEFAEFFAAGWAVGARGAFFEHFEPRFAPDAVFRQPLSPPLHGPEGARRLFEPLFAAIPDLHGELLRWGATHDGVLVELELRGTFGGKPIAWTTLDRIVLRDGLIASRTASFDPLPMLGQMARRPLALARLLAALVRARMA